MKVSPETTRVGFIGLGTMGRPMAGHLLGAGYHLVVHNRSLRSVREFVGKGAANGGTPAGVGRVSQVVITMLPGTEEVEQVIFGPDGLQQSMPAGSVLIDMSTISPVAARRFAAELGVRDVRMLDAPVSGGQEGARAGTLSIMVGGDAEVFESCRPLFEVMGRNIGRIGGSGAGQVAKACNQIIVAVTIQGVAEALTLAKKSGVDPADVRRALLGGYAHSRILELHGQRIVDGNYTPGGRARFHRKDLDFALALGRAAGVSLPATALVHELFGALIASGRGDLDHSALGRLVDDLAGTI